MIEQSALFKKIIPVIITNEGGYTDNPNDLGNWTEPNRTGILKGTKYGICARYFPYLDIKNLTMAQARQIYFEKYWLPMSLDGLLYDLSALQIFDFGVNAGKGRAVRTAQNIVGVKPDGLMGNITRQAINIYKDFVDEYKKVRILYYKSIVDRDPKNKVFLKGWLRRVDDTYFH